MYTTTVDVGRAYLDTLVSVMNDNGTTMPLALPNTGLQEQSYNNNINIKKGFSFRAALNPKEYTLQPTDQVQLEPKVTNSGEIASAIWASSPYLNCTNCINTTFTALYRQDTLATVSVRAYTQNGCYSDDTAKIHIPIVDDYTVKLNSLECSGTGNLHVGFSLCNAYTQGNIPASLQVDFYDRSPNDPAAVKLGNSFLTPAASGNECGDYAHSILRTTTGKVFAVVNQDRQAFPVTSGLNELVYDNNTISQDYTAPVLTVLPNDTTVFRKGPFNLSYNVAAFTPVTIQWNNNSAYTLSCNDCAAPVATMLDSGVVSMQLTNQYGCVLKGEEYIHIFPPDITVEMLSAACYDDAHIQVKFRMCIGNGYDTIYKQIPVSFYNGTPGDGQTVLLSPGYYTPAAELGPCLEFTHIVATPGTSQVVAVVNEQKEGAFSETNYTNNQSNLKYEPFLITATPDVITLARPGNVPLQTTVTGGTASTYLWEPSLGLSCSDCAEPVVTAASSVKYLVTATNNYYCKDTATIHIQTFVKTGVAMPNAFSPNGDGRNDHFYVMGGLNIRKVKNLSVFNRYGQKLFESLNAPANDRKFGWDGRVNGKRVDFDTYVYFVAVEYMDGTVQTFKGTVIVTP
jgi:gliding motility-associated-like protein